jgi:hypothetical protein
MRAPISLLTLPCLLLCHAAAAQDVTLDELQGAKITAAVNFKGYFRKQTGGEGPGYVTQRLSATVGPGAKVEATFRREVTAVTPAGNKSSSLTRTVSGALGRPGETDLGAHVWIFQDGSLISLRTREVGAQSTKISFSKTPAGLKCAIEAALMQEVGKGASKTKSAFGEGKVVMVNMKQTSSTCRVEMTK